MASSNPTIAVLIPAYNLAAYLSEAVRSVFAQSLPAAQVMVINDGSTDETAAVLTELQAEFPALTVISTKNQGVGAACHEGLVKVFSDYVVRLDGDDKMPDNYLEALWQSLKTAPKDVVFSYADAQFFDARTGWLRSHAWSKQRLIPENYINTSALVRTDAARQVGYFKPSMNEGFDDWDFYLSLAEAGFRGVYCRDTFLWYRQKPQGGVNTMTREREHRVRVQIVQNHPGLYQTAASKRAILTWRVKRRLKHWVGVS